MKYTAILLYPDYATEDYGADTFVDAAEAPDAYEAAKAVQQMAAKANENNDIQIPADDFRVIMVFEGDLTPELDATCFESR